MIRTAFGVLVSLAAARGTPGKAAEIDPLVSRSWEEAAPKASIHFQYRLFPADEVRKAEVTQGGKPVQNELRPFGGNPANTSALLVLVDTSIGTKKDPRNATIEENKRFIGSLLDKAQSRNLIGVYSFANDLFETAPVGAPFPEIRQKIGKLQADGLGTRIYRRAMDAVEKLATVKAQRKALLIVSDGKDEDTGFTKDDLIKAALKNGVTVFALGCPESGQDIPALGNLEKIARETKGLYHEAKVGTAGTKERAKADADFAADLLKSVESGGEIVVPAEVLSGDEVTFLLETETGEKLSYTHQRPAVPAAPAAAASPTPGPEASTPPAPGEAQKPEAPKKFPQKAQEWIKKNPLWAALSGAGALIVLVLTVVLLKGKKQPEPAPEEAFPAPPPFPVEPEAPATVAYLELQDADSRRIPLQKGANRIGRSPDNDIVFSNNSVSGYHAEIHVKRDGSHYITDLSSGNGIYLNNKPVMQSDLKDGDLIELGEVRFRYYRA